MAEQSKPALIPAKYQEDATRLSEAQDTLQSRLQDVTRRIGALPDGDSEFAFELSLLEKVAEVMAETTGILVRPETGPPAIAAETEIIELLLQSKRINPGGGGGSGSSPGGGGGGDTTDAAIALVGTGVNAQEVREDPGVQQTGGDLGPTLPEEFRAGLDEYFQRLENPGG